MRGAGVTHAPNAVLHPWRQGELEQILRDLPEGAASDPTALPPLRHWETWLDEGPEGLPPLRMLVVWDNLAGHKSRPMGDGLLTHGIAPLDTPLSGSWLTRAASLPRILVARALAGQHPSGSQEIIAWLEATLRGWKRAPTPFTWGGKRHERRVRARRLSGSGAPIPSSASIAA